MDHQGEVVHLQDVRELAQRVCQIDLEEKLWSVLAGRSPRKGVAERLVSPRGFFWSLLLTQETEWDSTLIKELKFTSIESVMPSNHLILCHPLFLLPQIGRAHV